MESSAWRTGRRRPPKTRTRAELVSIQPIRPDQAAEARRLILSVAWNTYRWPGTLDEIVNRFDQSGELSDLDDLQAEYAGRQGLFLAAMDGVRLVGTGAIRRYDSETAELRRLWLLEAYQGRGIGYRLVQELFDFARQQGFRRVRLLTDRRQERAIRFYHKVGFLEIPCASDDPNDVCMEMKMEH